MPPPARLSYEQSCRLLQSLGYLDKGALPPLPSKPPGFDDEAVRGVSFFRTLVADNDLQNLTLPRTMFGRTQVGPVSFRNTDLSESVLTWTDFEAVDFSDCDLSRADLRAANFVDVNFTRCDLRHADLRQSDFERCVFSDARMSGAKLTTAQRPQLQLSIQQQREINWHDDDGEEPPGG